MQWTPRYSCLPLLLLLTLAGAGSAASSVVFFSKTSQSEYDTWIPTIQIDPGGVGVVDVGIDRSSGYQAENNMGCRFRVTLPPGWLAFFSSSPNAVSVTLGDDTFDVQFTDCPAVGHDRP